MKFQEITGQQNSGERRKQEKPLSLNSFNTEIMFFCVSILPFTRKINIATAQILMYFLNRSFSWIKNQGLQDWLSITTEAEGNN